jgi:hypothetical protein
LTKLVSRATLFHMAGNAVSFTQPRLDDTAQRLLYKIATVLDTWLVVRGTGSPVGVVTPAFAGQLYEEEGNPRQLWRSNGTTNTSWVLV